MLIVFKPKSLFELLAGHLTGEGREQSMTRMCLTTDIFHSILLTEGLCMKGGIYSEQKCTICSGTLKDDGRKKVCYPSHIQLRLAKG